MATDDNNGRVTLAVLANKIEMLIEQVEKLNDLASKVAVLDAKITRDGEDLCRLEGRINNWSVMNSLGVVAASILGIFISPKGQ